MQDMQDMIDRLNQSGKRLSKGHRKIAQYIVEHYDKAVFMTASRLGESVGVSESTVVRFAAAMGYEGYPQLQRSLQELVSHRLTANQRFEMATELDPSAALTTVLKSDMQNLRNTLEQVEQQVFDEVVQRLLNANAVYVMGLRSAAPLAQAHDIHRSSWGIISIIFLIMCIWYLLARRMCSRKSSSCGRMMF